MNEARPAEIAPAFDYPAPARLFAPPADAAAAQRAERKRRASLGLGSLIAHASLIAAIVLVALANPLPDPTAHHEIPVEIVPADEAGGKQLQQAPQSGGEAAVEPNADTDGQQSPSAPAKAGDGVIVERPKETNLPQGDRTRGSDEKQKPQQEAKINPFGGLSPVKELPKAEPTPMFLSPQTFEDPDRPTPAPDPTNDNYRAKVLGKVAASMIEPERPRPKALAVVGFNVDEKGELTSAWLAKPTGSPELDAEALEMVRRAAPFPPPPAGAERNFGAAIAFGGD